MLNSADYQIEYDINNIIKFLSKRDIKKLTGKTLFDKFKIAEVDIIVILGNSIPYIAEFAAKAFKAGLAKELMIVGGIGHSTKYLIKNILADKKYKDINVENKSEAEILKQLLVLRENISLDKIIIENKSTNCGSNASEALRILKEKGEIPESIILIQDPTMQLRSHFSFIKEWQEEKTLIISYSPFIPQVKIKGNSYEYLNESIKGLWAKERLIDLIMGEIPRLRDDANGYGPEGNGFIPHIDIPEEVLESYKRLLENYCEYNKIKIRKDT